MVEEGGYLSGTITLEGTDIKSLQKAKLYDEVKDQLKKSSIETGERADTVYVIKNEQMSFHMTFARFSYLFRKKFLSV